MDPLVEDPRGWVIDPERDKGLRPQSCLLGEFPASAARRVLSQDQTPRGNLHHAVADRRSQLPDQRHRPVLVQGENADPSGVPNDLEEVPPLLAELHLHLFHVHHESPEQDLAVSRLHGVPVLLAR